MDRGLNGGRASGQVPRAVFDANVLFSAFGWKGAAHASLAAAERGVVVGIVCEQSFDDFARNLRLKTARLPSEIAEELRRMRSFLRVQPITLPFPALFRDPDDDIQLACAHQSGAHFLVTGDRDLLVLGSHAGAEIVTPAEFLRRLAS